MGLAGALGGTWASFSASPTLAPHLWEAKASVRPYRLCRS